MKVKDGDTVIITDILENDYFSHERIKDNFIGKKFIVDCVGLTPHSLYLKPLEDIKVPYCNYTYKVGNCIYFINIRYRMVNKTVLNEKTIVL